MPRPVFSSRRRPAATVVVTVAAVAVALVSLLALANRVTAGPDPSPSAIGTAASAAGSPPGGGDSAGTGGGAVDGTAGGPDGAGGGGGGGLVPGRDVDAGSGRGTSGGSGGGPDGGSGAARDAGGVDPGLAAALRAATDAAAADGIDLVVNDTYRSAAEQTRIFEEEVARTGSVEAARQRVFPATESMHVRGLAADIGSGPAADWLEVNGHRFGLCRTLAWEWWHVEWRPEWQAAASCPPPAATPDDAPTD